MKPVIYIVFDKEGNFEKFENEPWMIAEKHQFVTEFNIGIHLVRIWVEK